MKSVIVAIDFSCTTQPVIEEGVKLAKALGLGIHLIHVVKEEPSMAAYGFASEAYPEATRLLREAVFRSKDQLKELAENIDLEEVHHTVLKGSRVELIIQYAKENDACYIVLGSHGNHFVKSMLLGDLAKKIVKMSEIPMLIVPFNP